MPLTRLATAILHLDSTLLKKELEKIRDNFFGAVCGDPHLWLGGDEGTLVDRFTRQGDGAFGDHARFDLASVLQLPVVCDDSPDSKRIHGTNGNELTVDVLSLGVH